MSTTGRPEGESAATPKAQGKPEPAPANIVDRFRQSMVIDLDKWRDGIGYDLDLLRMAPPGDRAAIETLLVARGCADWRDVEALSILDTPGARAALRAAAKSPDHHVRIAIADYAPHLVADDERTDSLVEALERAEFYRGLTQALLQVEEFHPPAIVDALFRGTLARGGDVAVHFAAMLMFLHGKAESAFDWDQRPFFLRFNTDDPREREQAFRELCTKLAVNPDPYLRAA